MRSFQQVREGRDQDEGESGKGFHPRSDVLDASPLFFRLGSQHQTTIEQKLRLWLSLHQVHCQQIAQVDVLARHNLGDKLSWDRRKSGTNDERLIQQRLREHGGTIGDIVSRIILQTGNARAGNGCRHRRIRKSRNEGRHYHIKGKSRPTLLRKSSSCGHEIGSGAAQR